MPSIAPLLAGLLLIACSPLNDLELASGWHAQLIAAGGDSRPDMQVLAGDMLLQSLEAKANLLAPSLARIDLATGRRTILLYGLNRADGLKLAPDGSLWIGEESPDGLVWRIGHPAAFPAEQRVDRERLAASHGDIRPVLAAGRFAHEGLAFSRNGVYLYLADEWNEGCIYRLRLVDKHLEVLDQRQGWLPIVHPLDARLEAERLHGRIFDRIEDMETLPDGRILLAETTAGRIWALDDRAPTPGLAVFLQHEDIKHPDNLAWDERRGWLWITDDSRPSRLWAWDGKRLHKIAEHANVEITGAEPAADGGVYINLQQGPWGGGATLRLERK